MLVLIIINWENSLKTTVNGADFVGLVIPGKVSSYPYWERVIPMFALSKGTPLFVLGPDNLECFWVKLLISLVSFFSKICINVDGIDE